MNTAEQTVESVLSLEIRNMLVRFTSQDPQKRVILAIRVLPQSKDILLGTSMRTKALPLQTKRTKEFPQVSRKFPKNLSFKFEILDRESTEISIQLWRLSDKEGEDPTLFAVANSSLAAFLHEQELKKITADSASKDGHLGVLGKSSSVQWKGRVDTDLYKTTDVSDNERLASVAFDFEFIDSTPFRVPYSHSISDVYRYYKNLQKIANEARQAEGTGRAVTAAEK